MFTSIKKFILLAPRSFILTLVFLLLMSIDGILTPYFIGAFVDALTGQHFNQAFQLLVYWLAGLVTISLALLASSYFKGQYIRRVNHQIKDHLVASFISSHQPLKSSSFLARMTSQMKELEDRYLSHLFTVVYCLSQALVTLGSLLWISWPAALLFTLLGAIPALVPSLVKKPLRQATQVWRKANDLLVEGLENLTQGRQLFRRYQAQDEIHQVVTQAVSANETQYFRMKINQSLASALVSLLYSLSLIGALALAILSVKRGQLSAGKLLTLYLAGDRVLAPVVTAVTLVNEMTSVQPLLEELEASEGITTSSQALPYARSNQSPDLIRLDQGQVGYGETALLSEVKLRIGPEDKILIQGGSGQGKSTLLQALLLELPLQAGTLTYREDFNVDSFYQDLAVIDQEPVLLTGSLRYNLTLGKEFTDEALLTVLQEVHLDKYATAEGLATRLGSDALMLSGGETKRLEIARALLYQKRLLICDEPLSGLDASLSKELHQVLMAYPGAVLEVEHHLPDGVSARDYDQVWQVGSGRVKVWSS